jgi:putative Mg2+ transporter-C (MgtC) family protein
MARIVEGVITGMGFIGGGAILQTKNSVKGTATAASLWVTGAIGVAVGLGSYGIAVVLSAITFVTLWALSDVKDKIAPDDETTAEDGT